MVNDRKKEEKYKDKYIAPFIKTYLYLGFVTYVNINQMMGCAYIRLVGNVYQLEYRVSVHRKHKPLINMSAMIVCRCPVVLDIFD